MKVAKAKNRLDNEFMNRNRLPRPAAGETFSDFLNRNQITNNEKLVFGRAKSDRNIFLNIDFYFAIFIHKLDIDLSSFSVILRARAFFHGPPGNGRILINFGSPNSRFR